MQERAVSRRKKPKPLSRRKDRRLKSRKRLLPLRKRRQCRKRKSWYRYSGLRMRRMQAECQAAVPEDVSRGGSREGTEPVRRVSREAWDRARRVSRGVWDRARRAIREVWDRARRVSREGTEPVRRVSREGMESVRRASREVWDPARRVSRGAWDPARRVSREAWEHVRRDVPRQPRESARREQRKDVPRGRGPCRHGRIPCGNRSQRRTGPLPRQRSSSRRPYRLREHRKLRYRAR